MVGNVKRVSINSALTNMQISSGCWRKDARIYHISSELLTNCVVGVLGTIRLILLRSSLVTRDGVIGTTGENGWYGE